MKIRYESNEIRLELASLGSSHPDLDSLLLEYLVYIKELDYEDLVKLINEEEKKSTRRKWIKYLNDGEYEFRIPPENKQGDVLRVLFILEGDRYTLTITGSKVKSFKPSPKRGRK